MAGSPVTYPVTSPAAAGTLTATVETAWLPTFTVGIVPTAEAAAAGPAFVTRILKPKVTIKSGNVRLGTIAPAGDPGTSKWPLLALGLLAVGAFVFTRFLR